MQCTEQTPFSLDWMHPKHPEWGLEITWYDTLNSEQAYSAFWIHIDKNVISSNSGCFTFSYETLPELPENAINSNLSQWHLEKNNNGNIELRFKQARTEYVVLSIDEENKTYAQTKSMTLWTKADNTTLAELKTKENNPTE